MKDKEKQIEEIQGLLFCYKWEQPFTDCEEDIKCMECIAKQIYNAGYQKVDKNKQVVLTKEEYNNLKLEIQKAHNKGVRVGFDLTKFKENSIEQARKETAEKFLQLAYDRCLEKSFIKKVEELAKQYGVEIKN